ncbi:MAG TPA: hypothetical protein VMS65_04325 [Polyangiaceae bacterium]|nr:hypothetical protein [Polyangiaceae bacterium]
MAKPGGKNIASAVKETLDSVVSPSVRDAILARALAAGRFTQLPNEAAALDEFVQGPLHDSLVQSLGPELGVSVTTELERIIAIAAPHAARAARAEVESPEPEPARKPSTKFGAVGASRRASRTTMPSRVIMAPVSKDTQWADAEHRAISPTQPAGRGSEDEIVGEGRNRGSRRGAFGQPMSDDFPAGTASALGVIGTASVEPSSGGRPLVYVASTDPELLRVFQAWLDMRANVEPVSGVRELVAKLGANEGSNIVVVLDGRNPAVRPLALAALAEEMSEHTQVLLWGVAPHLHARMRNVSVVTEKWLVYGADATTSELVARCAKIVS